MRDRSLDRYKKDQVACARAPLAPHQPRLQGHAVQAGRFSTVRDLRRDTCHIA
ncbi:MAG: hypothetical protein VYC01_01650 [Nitrospinota bacterium]|nr:hypothetical protein [Nitrospinota bacterium]